MNGNETLLIGNTVKGAFAGSSPAMRTIPSLDELSSNTHCERVTLRARAWLARL
jgi:hypothetical protein